MQLMRRVTPSSTKRLARRRITSHLLLLAATISALLAAAATATDWQPSTAGLSGYQDGVTWADEFDGSVAQSPDALNWGADVQAWPFNGELQYYTNDTAHTLVQDGSMKITATKEPNGGREYTSARWSSQGRRSFGHGVFAARIQLSQGQGMWPSFRLFGEGPLYTEINVVEMAGGSAAQGTGWGGDHAFSSLLWYQAEVSGPIFRPFSPISRTVAPAKLADEFHVFWVEWTDSKVTFGLDGDRQELGNISRISALREGNVYLAFSLAVGGWAGSPENRTVLPQSMLVDWVRVWSKASQQTASSSTGAPRDGGATSSTGVATTEEPPSTSASPSSPSSSSPSSSSSSTGAAEETNTPASGVSPNSGEATFGESNSGAAAHLTSRAFASALAILTSLFFATRGAL